MYCQFDSIKMLYNKLHPILPKNITSTTLSMSDDDSDNDDDKNDDADLEGVREVACPYSEVDDTDRAVSAGK